MKKVTIVRYHKRKTKKGIVPVRKHLRALFSLYKPLNPHSVYLVQMRKTYPTSYGAILGYVEPVSDDWKRISGGYSGTRYINRDAQSTVDITRKGDRKNTWIVTEKGFLNESKEFGGMGNTTNNGNAIIFAKAIMRKISTHRQKTIH